MPTARSSALSLRPLNFCWFGHTCEQDGVLDFEQLSDWRGDYRHGERDAVGLCGVCRLYVSGSCHRPITGPFLSEFPDRRHLRLLVFIKLRNPNISKYFVNITLCLLTYLARRRSWACVSCTLLSYQGMTVDVLGIDLTKPVLTHGQLYTAVPPVRN
jgi:hypothetical protein